VGLGLRPPARMGAACLRALFDQPRDRWPHFKLPASSAASIGLQLLGAEPQLEVEIEPHFCWVNGAPSSPEIFVGMLGFSFS